MAEYGILCQGKWQECFDLIKNSGQISYIESVEKDLHPKEKARVRIRTIHGAKGDEAENVVIFPDMPRPAWKSAKRDPDTEHRMWFVAVTRAKQKVYWLNPETKYSYRIGNRRIA
jgi:superfamily I DNA/RNA helicase